MKPVQAYQCAHCKKLFMTDKHECKQNPVLKNCFTCAHLNGWNEGYMEDYHKTPNTPECSAIEPNWPDTDIEDLKCRDYNLQCPNWEQRARK